MKPQLSPRGHTTWEAGLKFFSLRLCEPWIYTPCPWLCKVSTCVSSDRHRSTPRQMRIKMANVKEDDKGTP